MDDAGAHVPEVEVLVKARRWEAALREVERVMDVHFVRPDRTVEILLHLRLDESEIRARRSGSAWLVLAVAYWTGTGGVEQDRAECFRCLCEGAALGHPLLIFMKGTVLLHGLGVPRDRIEGYSLMVTAARLGCRAAFAEAGDALRHGLGVERDLVEAAMWCQRGSGVSSAKLAMLMHESPLECTPFGRWEGERQQQRRIAPAITAAQMEWMLIAKRIGLARHLALLVAFYVCTPSRWV